MSNNHKYPYEAQQDINDLERKLKAKDAELAEAMVEIDIFVGRFETLQDACMYEGVQKYAKQTLDNHIFRTIKPDQLKEQDGK